MAVVTVSPRTCSGLAYSGVISCSPAAVGASVWPAISGLSSLAMPKSSSLGTPSCVDEHVGRLDVAVDDQVLVRVLHRRGQLQEEVEPRVGVEFAAIGVVDQRRAVDILHHQVGPSVGGGAAVEQPRDVRVVESGEDLPLGAEAADDRIGVHPPLEDLQRHPLVEGVVVAHGQEHRAHAALSQLADEPVGADARLERLVECVVGLGSGDVVGHGHNPRV